MPHEMKLRVYYEDTDAAGVVYYGNYLRLLERARTELLFDHGFDIYEYHRKGEYFVVSRVEIDYRRPALLGDIITIETEVSKMRNASMDIKQRVLRGDDLIVEAVVKVVWIDKKGKPKRFPEALRALGDKK